MGTAVFKDQVKVYVTAGNGGNGMSTFRREKFLPLGGPSGGDGGNGGSVYLVANSATDSLLDLYYRPHQKAEHGGKGGRNQQHGRNGKTLHIQVPCGTIVKDFESGEWLGEVLNEGDELLVCRGGKGGFGNARFKSSTDRAPTKCTPGDEGEASIVRLELKIISDIGLVGYPNAGKSTLLSHLSHAHPKVAPYPFTTLNPIIGTMEYEDFRKLKVADIPGLIDGAHEGIGLGHDFLRHIERTRFLVYIIDMGGVDGREPAEDFQHLREELRLYNEELATRPYLVVANKMDLPESEENLVTFRKETGESPLEMIAELDEGVSELRDLLYRHFFPKKPPAPEEV